MPAGILIAAVPMALAATGAFAHGVPIDRANPWAAWNLTYDIGFGTLAVAALYLNGLRRRWRKMNVARAWRAVAFCVGMAAIFLALQSPLDAIAEHSFLVHQVQHLLVRMIGPMLIFLAAPQAMLVAGTPGWMQRSLVTPTLTNHVVRGVFGFAARPVVATALFIGALYFWQVPRIHDLALLNAPLHYVMHASLLFVGLLFFWRILDSRPAPLGTRFGIRLMMLWIMILSNIVIGSYLAFKQPVLYSAYDAFGRLWHSALTDEQLGAITIWIPSSMMGLIALLIVIHMWGRHETEQERRRTAMLARYGHGWNAPPMTGADLIAQAAPKNRSMALGFVGFVLCVFAAVITLGVISLMMAS